MMPEILKGWTLLPAQVRMRGKVHQVWPKGGKGYVKENNDSCTVVFVWMDEKTLKVTVSSRQSLTNDRANAIIREFFPDVVFRLVHTENSIVTAFSSPIRQ